jgi:hypothetical protein
MIKIKKISKIQKKSRSLQKISKIRKKSRSQKDSRKTSIFQNFSGKSRRSGNSGSV